MMLEAVTLDIGGAMSPTFSVPDASGLTPLVLPDAFLGGRDPSQPQPSFDAVMRFEASMGGTGDAAVDGARAACAVAQTMDLSSPQSSEVPSGQGIVADGGRMENVESPAPVDGSVQYAGTPPPSLETTQAPKEAPLTPAEAPLTSAESPLTFVEAPLTPKEVLLTPEETSSAPVESQPARPVTAKTSQAPNAAMSASEIESRVSKLASEILAFADDMKDMTEEAVQAAPHVVVAPAAPQAVDASAQQTVQEVSAVSAAAARTESLVDAVNEIVEVVVEQIAVTPSLVHGEGEVRMTLKTAVLDGSGITLSAKDGALTVAVAPATPSAEQAMASALPRLEIALAEHVPAFRQVSVTLVARKGKTDEVA